MAEQTPVDWPTCEHEGCIGIRLGVGSMCLAHAGEEEREAELRRIGETGEVKLRGVPISSALLEQVIAAAPHDANGQALFAASDFEQATFHGNAGFGGELPGPRRARGPTFQGAARFDGATFQGAAEFYGATFQGDTSFEGATFRHLASFPGATFDSNTGFGGATFRAVDFGGATFQRASFDFATFLYAWFGGATFQDNAWFVGATFQARANFDDVTFQGDARFDSTTFEGTASFDGATFQRTARLHNPTFEDATFQGPASFDRATFQGHAVFGRTTFEGTAGFGGATFQGAAVFPGKTFPGDATFFGATFRHLARFDRATFHGLAEFETATFQGEAMFVEATFEGDAKFARATFQGASFHGATFRHLARFDGASFERTRQLGPLLAHRGLVLDDVQFAQRARIEVSTIGLCCRRSRFPAGVPFRLRWACVVLDETDFAAPSILTAIPRLGHEELAAKEARIAKAWQRLLGGKISGQPQLLSLRRADVAGLGLSNIDMANCRFAGAHNLDKLRLEADVSFATAPSRLGWNWRQVIAEECARRGRPIRKPPGATAEPVAETQPPDGTTEPVAETRGWSAPWWPGWLDDPAPAVLDPGQIAGLYRALRKGREDIKDEPGAADFYYGEMEMRRRAARPVERVVLTAYWLVSGYGLRAWRAIVWLAGITAALAVAFHLVGFVHPPKPDTYWTSWLYAFRATLSLTDPEVTLTAWGKFLQAVLRLTGPVLLGLAILALRGRVKR